MKTKGNNKEINKKLSEEGADNFTGGFSIPENYFEKLESDIQEKVNRIPILYTTKSETPFTVPEQYFGELENSIHEKISLTKERSASAPFYLRPVFIPVLSMALVVTFSIVTFFMPNHTQHSISEKDISFNDIYHSSYVADFDETELARLIEEPEVNSATKEYENYIIDHNTDINSITEGL